MMQPVDILTTMPLPEPRRLRPLRRAEYDRLVELGVFAKNLFDTYGILNAPFSFAGSITRPRTIGATLRFSLN